MFDADGHALNRKDGNEGLLVLARAVKVDRGSLSG
jgi:hypothetical protein